MDNFAISKILLNQPNIFGSSPELPALLSNFDLSSPMLGLKIMINLQN